MKGRPPTSSVKALLGVFPPVFKFVTRILKFSSYQTSVVILAILSVTRRNPGFASVSEILNTLWATGRQAHPEEK